MTARVTFTPSRVGVTFAPSRARVTLKLGAHPMIRFVSSGVQGPPGPAGPAGSSYEHTQAVVSSVWTVPHNLGYRPGVTVLTTGGLEVIADVLHLSADTLTITFLAPLAGTARLT